MIKTGLLITSQFFQRQLSNLMKCVHRHNNLQVVGYLEIDHHYKL